MVKKHTTIELNGKRYDTQNGQLIKSAVAPHKPSSQLTTSANTHIDGVQHKSRAAHTQSKVAAHVHHKTERSNTLMRGAVKKPALSGSNSHTASAQPIHHSSLEAVRIQRAQEISKSTSISKFGAPSSVIRTVTKVLAVKEPPINEPQAFSHHPPSPGIANPFAAAVEHATSHTLPKLKKPSLRTKTAQRLRVSTKIVNITASSLAVVLLTGFIAYQNIPNLSLRVAAARAGVRASLPDYQPSGFSLRGPIKANTGQITLNYHSNTDDRRFDVTQRNSGWDNQALITNHVALNQRSYQTFESLDKTIYMYGGNTATWVDKGVWYQIEGNSSLNSDQLLRIAASL